jgi:hypothetical protein
MPAFLKKIPTPIHVHTLITMIEKKPICFFLLTIVVVICLVCEEEADIVTGGFDIDVEVTGTFTVLEAFGAILVVFVVVGTITFVFILLVVFVDIFFVVLFTIPFIIYNKMYEYFTMKY